MPFNPTKKIEKGQPRAEIRPSRFNDEDAHRVPGIRADETRQCET